MIELLSDTRHISVTLIPVGEKIVMRVRLKGTSFDGRQDDVKKVYNDLLIQCNEFHYTIVTHTKSIEVMASKNDIRKSIGFIPEEVTRILWKHKVFHPEVLNVEVRKHVVTNDSTNNPVFGITARIRTGINTTEISTLTKEIEESLKQEKTDGHT